MYNAGNLDARPNLISYVTLINSISRSEQPGSAERAEDALHDMYDEYKSGLIAVPPNARLVTSVIDSWQKSGDRNAGERAEDLLDWLLEIYEAEGDDSLRPNEYTFNSGNFSLYVLPWSYGAIVDLTVPVLLAVKLFLHGLARANLGKQHGRRPS